MNNCPIELLTYIVELVCSDDIERSARTLSEVSKLLYLIAGPIRFRRLCISGLEQLEQALDAIDRSADPQHIRIHHLFICSYTKEHALANDTPMDGPKGSFYATEAGQEVEIGYYDQHPRFWDKTSRLLQIASPSLRTLSILDFLPYPDPVRYYNKTITTFDETRLLYALSSVQSFPCLSSLVVKHDLRRGNTLSNPDSPWHRPEMNKLVKLSLIARCIYGRVNEASRIHPLLNGIHDKHPCLEHLTILTNVGVTFFSLMSYFCGVPPAQDGDNLDSDASFAMQMVIDCIEKRRLPGNLHTAEARLGRSPTYARSSGFATTFFEEYVLEFLKDLRAKAMHGMVIMPFTPTYPEEGDREYEIFLSEWKRDRMTFE